MNYIIAENIKYKKSLSNYFIFIGPILSCILCFLLAGNYNFQTYGIYWWYAFMFPGIIALFCVEHTRKEKLSGNDKMIYSFPINRVRFRQAGMLVIAEKMLFMMGIFVIFLLCLPELLFKGYYLEMGTGNVVLAGVIIFVCSLWEVPLCFMIGRAIGGYITIIVNVLLNIIVLPFVANTGFWMIFPYCWGPKIVEHMAGIKVSGELAGKSGIGIIDFITVVVAIVFYVILMFIEAKWFERGLKE